jgi:hypothetical protein
MIPDHLISKMYQHYKTHFVENNHNIFSELMYKKIFMEDFILAKLSNDTCQSCDKLETIVKSLTVDEEV